MEIGLFQKVSLDFGMLYDYSSTEVEKSSGITTAAPLGSSYSALFFHRFLEKLSGTQRHLFRSLIDHDNWSKQLTYTCSIIN